MPAFQKQDIPEHPGTRLNLIQFGLRRALVPEGDVPRLPDSFYGAVTEIDLFKVLA